MKNILFGIIITALSWAQYFNVGIQETGVSTLFIFNEDMAIIGLLVLTISDSAAAIIGIKFGETQLVSKSLEGSVAFFITASIIVFLLSSAPAYVNFITVIVATFVELFSTPRINDNLLIPIAVALILTIGGIG